MRSGDGRLSAQRVGAVERGADGVRCLMFRIPMEDAIPRQSITVAGDLPPPDIRRWVPRRKAVIVEAVENGAISLEAACRRYKLSIEEFDSWQRSIKSHGVPGLRVTRLQIYRDVAPARPSSGATERAAAGHSPSK